jgi:hypothetical protein
MVRAFAGVCALFTFVFLTGAGEAGGKVKNQMVRGTIKVVDVSKDLLILNQKVKNEFVDRELSILNTTEFVIVSGGEKKQATGRDGLRLLEGKENSPVAVKCDKDVNVLKVTVTIKK